MKKKKEIEPIKTELLLGNGFILTASIEDNIINFSIQSITQNNPCASFSITASKKFNPNINAIQVKNIEDLLNCIGDLLCTLVYYLNKPNIKEKE